MHPQFISAVGILALALHFPSTSLACKSDLVNYCEYYSNDMRKVPAEVNEFPWMVFVKIILKSVNATKSDGTGGCGGILTAAHCVKRPLRTIVSVGIVAGAHNLMSPTLNEQTIHANSIIIHGDYNRTTLSKDIALIELNSALYFNEFVNSIPIQSLFGRSRFQGEFVQSGWGNVPCSCNHYLSDTLMKSNLTVIKLSESKIFAVGITGKGDSGGPLISKFNWGISNGHTGPGLVGITSGELLLSEEGIVQYGGPVMAFNRVEHFEPWIKVYAYGHSPASLGISYSELPAIKFTHHNYTKVPDDDISMINALRMLSPTEQVLLVITPILVIAGILLWTVAVSYLCLIRKRLAVTSKVVSCTEA